MQSKNKGVVEQVSTNGLMRSFLKTPYFKIICATITNYRYRAV